MHMVIYTVAVAVKIKKKKKKKKKKHANKYTEKRHDVQIHTVQQRISKTKNYGGKGGGGGEKKERMKKKVSVFLVKSLVWQRKKLFQTSRLALQ